MSQPGTMVPAPGSQIPDPVRPRAQFWQIPFVYEMDFANLVHQTTQNGNIQIQADSDFKWIKGTTFSDLAGAAQLSGTRVVPLATLQIQDSGTGRSIFQNPIQVSSFFGSGELPFIMPVPYIFKQRSTLQFTIANYSAATDYANVRLSLIGVKIFQGQAPAGAAPYNG